MASTPSASALSAVLRCQGNILARKQASKTRPAASVYGLGLKSSDRSYFRALLGYLFHRNNVEISGVFSVSTQVCSDRLNKNKKISKKCRKMKLKSDCYIVAFKSARHDLLSRSNLVLRVNDGHFGRIVSGYPMTFCVCIICAQSKSTMKQNDMNPLHPIGLLSLLKNRLMCLTAAVSGIVRTKLGLDWKNQIHPDCDKLSGCVKYTTEEHEDESEPRQDDFSEPEE